MVVGLSLASQRHTMQNLSSLIMTASLVLFQVACGSDPEPNDGSGGASSQGSGGSGDGTTGGSEGAATGGSESTTAGTGGDSNSGGEATGGGESGGTGGAATGGTSAQDPACADADSQGFFSTCAPCLDQSNCDSVNGRRACGCSGGSGCPCGFVCGSAEIMPNVFVSGICVP
jgi:hypothetical protein